MESLSSADKLAAAFADIASQRSLAGNYALNGALNALEKKDYKGAINQLRRALAYTPDSVDAYNLMASAYNSLGQYDEAVKAYKNVTRLNPWSSEGHKNLGNAYLQVKNYTEAEKELKTTARIDPTSTYAPYTLGFLYLNTDRLAEAKESFGKVVSLDRADPHGYYGLGLVYNKMGKPEEAITQLKEAVRLDPEFALAHAELGRAYSDAGERENAQEEVTLLDDLDPLLGSRLSGEIFSPRIIAKLYSENSINTALRSGTKLTDLILEDPDTPEIENVLVNPNASHDFEMIFQFDTAMDITSVQDPTKWSITKAAGGPGGIYNDGITINPDDEISVTPTPKSVMYNAVTMQATVIFTITQNAAGDGVIDPAHLVFKFSGKDANGNEMDPDYDQYDGAGILPF